MCRLLDRQLGDVDDGAAEPAVELLGLRRAPRRSRRARRTGGCGRARPSPRTRARRISASRSGSIVSPTTLAWSTVEQLGRRRDPFDDGHVRGLVAEVAEVDRERRLRGAGDADEDDVRVVEAVRDAVVEADGELDRLHPLEVRGVERRPRARRHRSPPGPRRGRRRRSAGRAGRSSGGAPGGRACASPRGAAAGRACRRRPPDGPASGSPRAGGRPPTRRAGGGSRRTPAPGTAPRAPGRAAPRSRRWRRRRRAARPAGSASAVSVTGALLWSHPKPPPTRGRERTSTNHAVRWQVRAERRENIARVTSAHGGDGATGDDGHDRLPLPPPRLRLPLLRDLRRPRLDVRLRPLRRPHEEQHPLALVPRDGAGA